MWKPEAVKSDRQSTIVDVYMEKTEKVLAMIDDCRRQNSNIENKLSFLLNDPRSEECDADCGQKVANDDMATRLNSIIGALELLLKEQSDFSYRIDY